MDKDVLKVSDVAEHLGISVKTLKNLEEKGVFPEPERNDWNHRVYRRAGLADLGRRLKKYKKRFQNKRR